MSLFVVSPFVNSQNSIVPEKLCSRASAVLSFKFIFTSFYIGSCKILRIAIDSYLWNPLSSNFIVYFFS